MDEQEEQTGDNDDNSSPSRPLKFPKRDSLFGDELDGFDASALEDEDWKDVFDDDDDSLSDNIDPSVLMPPPPDKKASLADKLSLDEEPKPPLDQSARRRRRTTATTVGRTDKGPPPPTWQSEGADLAHRQAMTRDIAALLLDRKKEIHGKKWLDRLPLKARMLETQLYRNAPSLEAYLNRKTLKDRLGKLASAITSHYKQALRRSSGQSNSTVMSVSSLGSLENAFGSAKLRRESTGSMPGLPGPIGKLRRGESESAVGSSSSMKSNKMTRQQSDSILSKPPSNPLMAKLSNSQTSLGDNDLVTQQMMQNSSVPNLNGAMNPMNQQSQQQQQQMQIQQQLLASMRQQQQNLTNQMNMGMQASPNNPMMVNAMMGNNGMAMMNQIQQQNALNMNLLQQQQNRAMGVGMQNMGGFPQQVGQSNQNNATMFMGNVATNNSGMNMMNFSLPNVIPGVGGNFQNNFNGVTNGVTNQNTGGNPIMMRDNSTMPPPAGTNAAATTPRRSTTGGDEASPLSPGSFNW